MSRTLVRLCSGRLPRRAPLVGSLNFGLCAGAGDRTFRFTLSFEGFDMNSGPGFTALAAEKLSFFRRRGLQFTQSFEGSPCKPASRWALAPEESLARRSS